MKSVKRKYHTSKPGSSWGMARHKANRELTSSISVREDIGLKLNRRSMRKFIQNLI